MRLASMVVLCLFLGSFSAAHAQSVNAGIKGGVNIANIQFVEEEEHIDFDGRIGFVGGLFVVWPANARIGLQLEALYSQKGAELDAPDAQVKLRLDYLDVPVMLRVSSAPNSRGAAFQVFGGPSLGIRVRAKANATFEGQSGSSDVGDDLSRHDVGLVAGAGVELGRFLVDVRHTWGLTNINRNPDEDDTTIKNRAFAATVGFRF